MPSPDVDLTPYAKAARRNVWAILTVGLVFGLLGVAATAVIKPQWQAEASLLLASQDQAASSALSALVGRKEAKPLAILKGIVRSRSALERVAKEAGVDRELLEESLKVTTVDDANQLTLTIGWKDKDQAIGLLQDVIDTLEAMRSEIGFTVANRQSKLIEQAIKKKEQELDTAESAVMAFQKRMKAPVDPTAPSTFADLMKSKKQLEADVKALASQIGQAKENALRLGAAVELPSGLPNAQEWQTKLSKAEYDLQIAQVKFGPAAPEVVRLKREVEITREQLQKAVRKHIAAVSSNVDATIADLQAQKIVAQIRLDSVNAMVAAAPDEAKALNKLLREVAALTEVLASLRQQYELKKIEEIGNVSWSVLEAPFLTQEDPINKQYARNGVLGFLVGCLLAVGVTLVRERQRPAAETL